MGFDELSRRRKANRGKLSASGYDTFTHKVARTAKVELRTHALEFVGAVNAYVFDAFCGPGEMHRAVWARAASYVGCDREWFRDSRRVFVGDSAVVLRAIDLSPFNVFDLDAFGSPWEHAWIVASRRNVSRGEKIAMVLTCGEGLKLKAGMLPHALAYVSGFPVRFNHANRAHDTLIDAACKRIARRMNCDVTKMWVAKKQNQTALRYVTLAMTGRET